MPHTRVAAPGKHLPVDRLNGGWAMVPLHPQPGAGWVHDAGGEYTPGLYQTLAENLGTPIGVAFPDLCRCKEKCRARTGQVFSATEMFDMGAANGATVFEIGKTRVNRAPQVGIAGEVDVDAGRIGNDLVQLLVPEDTVVTTQAIAERQVGRRSQADHFNAAALLQRIRRAISGLAGRAGQQHHAFGAALRSAEKGVVGQKVIDQPGRRKQGPQQCLHVLGLVLTADPSRCLLVYPRAEWEPIQARLMAMSSFNETIRALQRLIVGHADDVDMDGAGRILVPPSLRQYAALGHRVVLVGQGNKFELWDESRWLEQTAKAVAFPTGSLPPELAGFSL